MKNKGLIILMCVLLVLSLFSVSCSLFQKPEEPKEDKEERIEKDEDEKDSFMTTDTPEAEEDTPEETATPEPQPEVTATPKPIYTLSPTGTAAPTNTPAPEGSLRNLDFSGSSSFGIGTYVLGYTRDQIDYDIGDYDSGDINFQIHDEITGSYYVSDAQNNRFEAYDFTYTYIDNVLTMLLDTGDILVYTYKQTDNDEIVLSDDAGLDYHFYMPYEYLYTAFGSWVTVNNDGTLGYICYWNSRGDEGIGYAKYWEDTQQVFTFSWYYAYGLLQHSIHNDVGDIEDAFYEHYGNAVEFIIPYYDYYTMVLYRADGDIMYGYYRLNDTDSDGNIIKELNLMENGSANAVINEDGEDVVYDRLAWYTDIVDGTIIFRISYDNILEFEYFYGGDVLILRDEMGYTYSFDKGINPDGN